MERACNDVDCIVTIARNRCVDSFPHNELELIKKQL